MTIIVWRNEMFCVLHADLRANGTLLLNLKKANLMPLAFDPNETQHVWYNRVPKTGSTTVCMEFRFRSMRNHFIMTRDSVFTTAYLQPHEMVTTTTRLYDSHLL